MTCPLRCFYEYILELPAPTNPEAAFGTALHYLFCNFFTLSRAKLKPGQQRDFHYLTKAELLGAWWSFWWSAVETSGATESGLTRWLDWCAKKRAEAQANGKRFHKPKPHGFGAWSEPVDAVCWRTDDDPDKYFRYGQKVLSQFFDLHDPIRRDGRRRWAERAFSFTWGNVVFSGQIDRLDLEPGGAVVVDYKPSRYPLHLKLSGLQLTAYQRAYEECIRPNLPQPQTTPLKAIRIYSYWSGQYEDIPLRTDEEVGRMGYYLAETEAYFRGVLAGKAPDPFAFTSFVNFRWADLAAGTTTPRLPVGDHCTYCAFPQACAEYVRGDRPIARVAFHAKHDADVSRFTPDVQRLPFADSPIVRDTAAHVAALPRLYASLGEQLSLGMELPTPSAQPRRRTSRKQPKRHAQRVTKPVRSKGLITT